MIYGSKELEMRLEYHTSKYWFAYLHCNPDDVEHIAKKMELRSWHSSAANIIGKVDVFATRGSYVPAKPHPVPF